MVAQEQGPNRDSGATVARPKKPADDTAAPPTPDPDQPKIPSAYKRKAANAGDIATFKSDVDMVTVDVAVVDNKGHFIPGIPKGNFRVLEDNVPQQIRNVTMGEAPLTVAMVIEFSNLFQRYWSAGVVSDAATGLGFREHAEAGGLCGRGGLRSEDRDPVGLHHGPSKTQEALSRLTMAGFSEANLFDAVTDTADRMSGIEGRKAILLIASGPRHSEQNHLRSVPQKTTGIRRSHLRHQPAADPARADGRVRHDGSLQRMDFLQADNEMRTFSKETGGMAFFPRFEGEYPRDFPAGASGAAQPIRDHVRAQQQGSRWQLPQDQGATGGSRHE